MPRFRMTLRYGGTRARYEILDVEADNLRDALREAADAFPPEAEASADLVEIRRQPDPDARLYGPE